MIKSVAKFIEHLLTAEIIYGNHQHIRAFGSGPGVQGRACYCQRGKPNLTAEHGHACAADRDNVVYECK